ncbi:MAG: alpha/beta hydrolase [Brevinematales bacterium]
MGWVIGAGIFLFFVFIMINESLFWVRWLAKGKDKVFLSSLEMLHSRKTEKAVLLLHEFSGLPVSLRELGTRLYEEGWDVYIPAMPETVEKREDLDQVKVGPLYFLWYEQAEKSLQSLLATYKNVVVGGASIGGSIAIHLASWYGVKAVFAVAAPYGLFGWHYFRPFSRNLMLLFSGWVGLFFPWWEGKNFSPSSIFEKRYGIEGVIWARAIHTQRIGLRQMRKRLALVKAPCFLVQSNNDRTVNPLSIVHFMRAMKGVHREAIVFDMQWDKKSRRHLLLNHEGVKERVMEQVVEFLRRIVND